MRLKRTTFFLEIRRAVVSESARKTERSVNRDKQKRKVVKWQEKEKLMPIGNKGCQKYSIRRA